MARKLAGAALAPFRRKLLAWYRRERRDLPWRRTRDPYRIWLAEIMLQQTRVAAVIPYYDRFLDRFPTVEALAHAPIEDVLQLWSGLGYYSRARNLHRAAQEIVSRHGGEFPRDAAAALALPGIGRYTAAAILSIAYGEPCGVLDGNVARVLARLDAIRGDLRAPGRWRALEARAQELLAPREAGDWNQAMMELGATICLPKGPRCGVCPARSWCRANELGIADELPMVRRKPKARAGDVGGCCLCGSARANLASEIASGRGCAVLATVAIPRRRISRGSAHGSRVAPAKRVRLARRGLRAGGRFAAQRDVPPDSPRGVRGAQ